MRNRKEQHEPQLSVDLYVEVVSQQATIERTRDIVTSEPIETLADMLSQGMQNNRFDQLAEHTQHLLDSHSGEAQDDLRAKREAAKAVLSAGLFSKAAIERRAKMAAECSSDTDTLTVSSVESSPVTPRM